MLFNAASFAFGALMTFVMRNPRMFSLRHLFAFAFAFTLLGCSDDETSDELPTVPVWEVAFDTSGAGSLSGVWGSGPSDVFVVGGSSAGGEIHHFDGSAWSRMSTPPLPLLVWVFGFGPNDVFTVGLEGAMAHYDGSAWSVIDTGTTEQLWGVFGFSPDAVWVVGGSPFAGDPIVMRYDGSSFTSFAIDAAENPNQAKALFKVWGIDGELFSVGQKGLIVRFDGSAWKATPAGMLGSQDFVSLWGTASDHIVAVGGRNNAQIATWDGNAWDTIRPDERGGLNAVHMVAPGYAVVGGVFGFVGRYDVAERTVTAETDPFSRVDVHAIWADGQGKSYAVGGTFQEPHEGIALVRTAKP